MHRQIRVARFTWLRHDGNDLLIAQCVIAVNRIDLFSGWSVLVPILFVENDQLGRVNHLV